MSESTSALRFPANVSGSDTSAPYGVIEFANPHDNGLPIWGPSNTGVTVVRRVRTQSHTGYYAMFWWEPNKGTFDGALGYWGMHPYPQTGTNAGTTHWHEIAIIGGDYLTHDGLRFDEAGGPEGAHTVSYNVWERQGMRVVYTNANSKTLTYYHDTTSISNTTKVTATITSAGYGNSAPATPANSRITIGDSSWYSGFQHERANMDMTGIKIFAAALSEADMVSEAADFSQVVTAAGQSAIWWGKNGFDSVNDLTCDFGTGRSFTKDDTSNVLSVVST